MLYKIIGFGGYALSKDGDVYSTRFNKLRRLKAGFNNAGYLHVTLCKDGKHYTSRIHTLMAKIFLKYDKSLQVNHINGIKTDNRLDNLEMISCSDNLKHAYKIGLSSRQGENHNLAKLNNEKVIIIKRLLEQNILTQEQIADIFEITSSNVSLIKSGKRWSHVDSYSLYKEITF